VGEETKNEKQMVHVEISGVSYRIATPFDETYMQEIAAQLNEKIAAIQHGAKTRSIQQTLILVALDILDDHIQLQKKWESEKAELRQSVKELLKDVDSTLESLEVSQ